MSGGSLLEGSFPALVVSLFIVACDDRPTLPADWEPPDTIRVGGPVPPLIDFQQGDVVLGRVVYSPCPPPNGAWWMDRLPSGDPMTLDLVYRAPTPIDPSSGVAPADIEEVEGSGAEIVTIGESSVIRIRVSRGMLVLLKPHLARAVPDPARLDVRLGVVYSDPSVREVFEELGGVITDDLANISVFYGVLPDDRFQELRVHPSVAAVDQEGVFCTT